MVENLCERVCRRPACELSDLSQIIYCYLLDAREEILTDLWNGGQMNFYIVRMIRNQYFSRNSRYFYEFRQFLSLSNPLTKEDAETDS